MPGSIVIQSVHLITPFTLLFSNRSMSTDHLHFSRIYSSTSQHRSPSPHFCKCPPPLAKNARDRYGKGGCWGSGHGFARQHARTSSFPSKLHCAGDWPGKLSISFTSNRQLHLTNCSLVFAEKTPHNENQENRTRAFVISQRKKER